MGKIITRRIDLRGDVADVLAAALPHELCHVVMADHFRDVRAPLWFDEGVALLYDPLDKQRLHDRDLMLGLNRGDDFALPELLALAEYPRADRWRVFYGQSTSLVRCLLLAKGSPRQLLRYVKLSPHVGVNLGLQQTYGIAGIGELELLWRKELHGSSVNLASARENSDPALPGISQITNLPDG